MSTNHVLLRNNEAELALLEQSDMFEIWTISTKKSDDPPIRDIFDKLTLYDLKKIRDKLSEVISYYES